MKKQFFALGLISALAVACTLSLDDKNPKGLSLFGTAGAANGSIANGSLTLTGTNLDTVTAVALTQSGGPDAQLGPITARSANHLVLTLPPILKLPGMLLVSSAAGAAQFPLATLDALAVDGTLSVTGNTTLAGTLDLGFEKVQMSCATSTGFCSVTCPAGKKIINGGCFAGTSGAAFSANYPSGDNQWTCRPAVATTVDAYAICGRVTLTY